MRIQRRNGEGILLNRKGTKQQILKEKLERLFLEEGKTLEEVSTELNIPLEVADSLVKFFRLEKTKEIRVKTEGIKEELEKRRTREEAVSEFRKLKRELGRTPMLTELPQLGRAGLRRDILRHWSRYSDFLKGNRLGRPRPREGAKHGVNFRHLASEAAINYQERGKWSRSEEKVARILREEFGLLENLDWWHNFKLKSPNQDGSFFELDFYLPKYHLNLEADSCWHSLGESKAKDGLRDLWVREYLNCETLRFKKFNQKGLAAIRKSLKEKLKEKGSVGVEAGGWLQGYTVPRRE